MIRKPFQLLIAFIFLFSQNALAEDQFLETCLRFAQVRDKKLNVALDQIKLSQIRIVRSARNFLPQLSLERKYVKGKTLTDEFQEEELGIRGTQTIYEGGKVKANYQYDSMMLDSARFNYTKTREELFYRVKSAYYDYMTSKMEYDRLRKAFAEIDTLCNRVQLEYKAKAISEVDKIEAVNFRDKVENMTKSSELSLSLNTRILSEACCVDALDQIPAVMPESLPEDVPEISYVLDECVSFVKINNVDLKINKLQVKMADTKRKITQSKAVPKIYLEGFYGQSGEAYVTQPLELATSWNITGKVQWTFWGNSLEVSETQDRSLASDILDVGTRIDSAGYNMKMGVFDDLTYFVDSNESKACKKALMISVKWRGTERTTPIRRGKAELR